MLSLVTHNVFGIKKSVSRLVLAIIVSSTALVSSCKSTGFTGSGDKENPAKIDKEQKPKVDLPKADPIVEDDKRKDDPIFNPVTPPSSDPRKETFIGGSNKIFHIGDGEFNASSCKIFLILKPSTGKATYEFSFELDKDPGDVELSIGTVCGVDFPVNEVIINNNGTQKSLGSIPKGAWSYKIPKQTFGVGKHSIIVKAGINPNLPKDLDNFLVGRVKIKTQNASIKTSSAAPK